MPTTWLMRSSVGSSPALKSIGLKIVERHESRNCAAATVGVVDHQITGGDLTLEIA